MSLPFDGPPLDPTSPEARQWVRDELAQGGTRPSPSRGSASSSGCATCCRGTPSPRPSRRGSCPWWSSSCWPSSPSWSCGSCGRRPGGASRRRTRGAVDEEGLTRRRLPSPCCRCPRPRGLGRRPARLLPSAGGRRGGAGAADRAARTHRRTRSPSALRPLFPAHAGRLARGRRRLRRRPLRPPPGRRGHGPVGRWRLDAELGRHPARSPWRRAPRVTLPATAWHVGRRGRARGERPGGDRPGDGDARPAARPRGPRPQRRHGRSSRRCAATACTSRSPGRSTSSSTPAPGRGTTVVVADPGYLGVDAARELGEVSTARRPAGPAVARRAPSWRRSTSRSWQCRGPAPPG